MGGAAYGLVHETGQADIDANTKAQEWLKNKCSPHVSDALRKMNPALFPFRCFETIFVENLMSWHKRFKGDDTGFLAFARCALKGLHDVSFSTQMITWWDTLGPKLFVTFICGSVAARLLDKKFTDELVVWYVRLGPDLFVTFICGSVAARLLDEKFTDELMVWYVRLGSTLFVTFICDGVAARLLDEKFTDQLMKWLGALGDVKFVRFVSHGSVAARLLIPEVCNELEFWREKLGDAKFVTMCRDSAVKLMDSATNRARLLKLYELLPDNFQTLMNEDRVASRLAVTSFFDFILALVKKESGRNKERG
jgi:hypothetical protein